MTAVVDKLFGAEAFGETGAALSRYCKFVSQIVFVQWRATSAAAMKTIGRLDSSKQEMIDLWTSKCMHAQFTEKLS